MTPNIQIQVHTLSLVLILTLTDKKFYGAAVSLHSKTYRLDSPTINQPFMFVFIMRPPFTRWRASLCIPPFGWVEPHPVGPRIACAPTRALI